MKVSRTCIICIALLCLSITNFAQTLSLGSAANFVLFSSTGAVSNTGQSTLTGNVGTNIGAISGFDSPTTLSGTIYNADAVTAKAKIDLLNAYIHLCDIPVTNTSHSPVFGGNETISAGIYSIGGAGSINGTLILDGEQNPDAVFIFKFEGALTGGTSSIIVLTNSARATNVFWISEGPISIGASSTMKGNLIAHPGAVTIGAASTLEGRMFSTEGAININNVDGYKPSGQITIPIKCDNSCSTSILGSVENFAMFSSAGAVSNAGSSAFIGHIGSNSGAVSGFENSTLVGSLYNADAITAQAKIDLESAYVTLINTTVTNSSHAPAFGSGETLFPGVYQIGGAGSIAGTLILDGEGNNNALFIFKFGGAFSTAAQSKVILKNGARRCNIFWVAEGAIGMGTFSHMKGTLIAHNEANSMGANGNLEGRMLSTMGAVSFSTGVIYTTYNQCTGGGTVALPIELISFEGNCQDQNVVLKWSTVAESENKNFTIERSIDGIHWEIVGKIKGAINSSTIHNYTLTDNQKNIDETHYYRLKQTDVDDTFKYFQVIIVRKCNTVVAENLSIFPNPSNGYFNINFAGNKKLVSSIKIFNSKGEKISQSVGFKSVFNLSNELPGSYILRIYLNSEIISRRLVLVN